MPRPRAGCGLDVPGLPGAVRAPLGSLVLTRNPRSPAPREPGPGEGGPEGERAPGPWSSPAAPCRYEGELSPVDQKLSALRSPLAQRPFFEVPTPLGDVDLYEYACGDDDLQPL